MHNFDSLFMSYISVRERLMSCLQDAKTVELAIKQFLSVVNWKLH